MHDDLDWPFIAYALSDASRGMQERWDAVAERAGDGKRAKRIGKLLGRVGEDLGALSALLAHPDFAGQARKTDRALADAIAGPLLGLGEDLRAATPRTDRTPPSED